MEPPEFVRRLAPDPLLARNAAFAIFVLSYLEATGAVSGDGTLPERVKGVRATNEHLLAYFGGDASRAQLAALDQSAAGDLAGWARAQRLEREESQVAYELGLLALGLKLPPIMVRSLRELPLTPESTVAELPDGGGYPTVFLSTLHPDWPAAERATILVTSTDARQLAAWAVLLLTRDLRPGSRIQPVDTANPPTVPQRFDYAISYHTPSDLAPERFVRAGRVIVV